MNTPAEKAALEAWLDGFHPEAGHERRMSYLSASRAQPGCSQGADQCQEVPSPAPGKCEKTGNL